MAKEITLQYIVDLIEAQNKHTDERFEQIDARFDDIKRDIGEIRFEQTKLNKLYEQIFNRVCGIESDIKEIYDRLVMVEEKSI